MDNLGKSHSVGGATNETNVQVQMGQIWGHTDPGG